MIQCVNWFSKDSYTCDYFIDEKFNSVFKHYQRNSLKFFHASIGSFYKNKFELASHLKSLKCTFQIIALTELDQTTKEFIEQIFYNYEIFLDEAPPIKGGAALLVPKKCIPKHSSC